MHQKSLQTCAHRLISAASESRRPSCRTQRRGSAQLYPQCCQQSPQYILSPARPESAQADDPGDWQFTKEWATGDAWGPGSGDVVYSEESDHGNGTVTVTGHACSYDDPDELAGPADAHSLQQWRVLHFNKAGHKSDQSVARTTLSRSATGSCSYRMQANCLAFQYTKTLASLVAAAIGLQPGLQSAVPGLQTVSQQEQGACHALFIGLGGGSLPLFLACAFPDWVITVVEIDPVVIKAASVHMGFPLNRAGLEVQEGDALQYIAAAAKSGKHYDLVVLDAFNGANRVPQVFTDPGLSFVSDLAAVLHPEHGTFLMNLHGGKLPNPLVQLAQSFSADPMAGAGFDASRREGGEVLRLSSMYRNALLLPGNTTGAAFVVKALRQLNVSLVISRGLSLPQQLEDAKLTLEQASRSVAQAAGYPFSADARSSHYLWRVPRSDSLQ